MTTLMILVQYHYYLSNLHITFMHQLPRVQ